MVSAPLCSGQLNGDPQHLMTTFNKDLKSVCNGRTLEGVTKAVNFCSNSERIRGKDTEKLEVLS
jgi:hypothetical protein